MSVDSFRMFTISSVAVAPSPASSGTTMSVQGVDAVAGIFVTPPFNLTCSPPGQTPTIYNSEVVRVTAMSGASITAMIRAQENTTAQNIQVGWVVEQGITPLILSQLEALAGTAGPTGPTGPTGPSGPSGPQGPTGTAGGTGGTGGSGGAGASGSAGGDSFNWTFSTATTATPATGVLNFNSATVSSVTSVYVNQTNYPSVNVANWIAAMRAGGVIKIFDNSAPANFAIFNIGSTPTLTSGVYTIPVTYVIGNGTFDATAGDTYVSYVPPGGQGATGPTGGTGGTGPSGGTGGTGGTGSGGSGGGNPSYLAFVACVSTANVATLSGLNTYDGYTLAAGDEVLLSAQSTASQDGPWLAATGAWTRPTGYTNGTVIYGAMTTVMNGTVYANTVWTMDSPTAGTTVGTSSQTWKRPIPLKGDITAIEVGLVTVTVAQSATPAIDTDNGNVFEITGLAQAITSMTTNLTGTPSINQKIEIKIKDNGTNRAITWGADFVAAGNSFSPALPTTTTAGVWLRVGFEWDAAAVVWTCLGSI